MLVFKEYRIYNMLLGLFYCYICDFGKECKVISKVCIKEVKSGQLAHFVVLALRKL